MLFLNNGILPRNESHQAAATYNVDESQNKTKQNNNNNQNVQQEKLDSKKCLCTIVSKTGNLYLQGQNQESGYLWEVYCKKTHLSVGNILTWLLVAWYVQFFQNHQTVYL